MIYWVLARSNFDFRCGITRGCPLKFHGVSQKTRFCSVLVSQIRRFLQSAQYNSSTIYMTLELYYYTQPALATLRTPRTMSLSLQAINQVLVTAVPPRFGASPSGLAPAGQPQHGIAPQVLRDHLAHRVRWHGVEQAARACRRARAQYALSLCLMTLCQWLATSTMA